MRKKILCVLLAVLMIFSSFAVVCEFLPQAFTVKGANVIGDDDEDLDDPEEPVEDDEGEWIASWGSGMTNITLSDYSNIYASLAKVAARVILTPTASGDKIRLKLSNIYGKKDVEILGCTVAKSVDGGVEIYTKTPKPVYVTQTRDGEKGLKKIIIPAGREIYTDAIDFPVTAGDNIAVSFYCEKWTDFTTIGLSGGKTYIAAIGDSLDASSCLIGDAESIFTGKSKGKYLPWTLSTDSIKIFSDRFNNLPSINIIPFLSAVDVYSEEENPGSIVVIGDSTVANDVPEYLSKLIRAEGMENIGVCGKGILGNSLLSDGAGKMGNIYGESLLNRMDADVLGQSGVKYAIIKIGANDITHPESESIKTYYGGPYVQPTAKQMIEGFKSFADRCHEYGIKVIACSITQFKGTTRNYFGTSSSDDYTWKESDWQIALDVNKWMKTATCFDAFVDLNTVSASATDDAMLSGTYTSDYIHPNDKLQQVWAKTFDLSLFGVTTMPSSIKLNFSSKLLSVGKTVQLQETILPKSAGKTQVTWKSSNEKVASVDNYGKVTALKKGTATISCTTVNGKTAKCKITVAVAVSDISVSKKSLTLYETGQATLSVHFEPEDATNQDVKWITSDESVASVSSKGVVTGIKKGSCVITCISDDGGYTADCSVTVLSRVKVTGVTVNAESKTLYRGSTLQLKAIVSPSNASNQKITWKTSKSSVATVDSSGLVTPVANGTADIIVTTADGYYTAVCTVTVKTHASSVSLDITKKTIKEKDSFVLVESVSPSSASNKAVKWSSTDENVAKVNDDGVVTAVGAGKCTITCTTVDSNRTANCAITVKGDVPVTSVELNYTTKTFNEGNTFTLIPTVLPTNASNKSVTWQSTNTKVAKVSSSGVVTAVGEGTCTIICTTSLSQKTAMCEIIVNPAVPVSSVKLSKTSVTLDYNKTVTLKATVSPYNAKNKTVKWTSSNSKIASVSSTGVVTAKGEGTAVITCKTVSGGKKATCTVKVNPPVAVKSVKLNKSSIKLDINAKYTLKATVSPSNAAVKTVKWSSSNTKVATVSSSGTVKAIGKGKATITCTTTSGKKTAKCTVTVNGPVKAKSIELNSNSKTIKVGEKFKLKATVYPSNTTDKTVVWKSSNKKIAKVASKGTVTGVKAGTATITCTSKDGKIQAICEIKVTSANVTAVKLNYSVIMLEEGDTKKLKATVSPSSVSDKTVTWKSSNTKVAKVSSSGKVTAVGDGNATITCTTNTGKKKATCKVIVTGVKKQKVIGVKISQTGLALTPGQYYTLKATVLPSNAANKSVVWTSTNPTVATVNQKGMVVAKSAGTARIKVTTVDGSCIAMCTVVVS